MTQTASRVLTTGHVGLNVTDLARSVDFYRRALGFEVVAESQDADRRWAFLGTDGAVQVTLWQQSDGEFSPNVPGLHHLSFQVDSIERVREIESVLREHGVTFTYDGVVAHREGAASGGVFFTDPDGIRLEIYVPTGAQEEQAPTGDAPTCGFF
jgi:lactoylglutathione lyase